MKKVQQMRTIFPIGLSEDSNVCTTSFKPGALFITRSGRKDRNNLNTYKKKKKTIQDFHSIYDKALTFSRNRFIGKCASVLCSACHYGTAN